MKYLLIINLLISTVLLAEANPKAIAELKSLDGMAQGIIKFEQIDKKVKVSVEVEGLTPGEHGFHVHQFGDCTSTDGKSAGGHFVGSGEMHAGPEAAMRHVGDLGNIIADNNTEVKLAFDDAKISLTGEDSIIGRAVVIHAGKDDMASQPSGAAGSRVACGVIGISE